MLDTATPASPALPAQIPGIFRISVQYNNFQHYYLLFFPLVYEPNRYCSHGYVPRGVCVRFLRENPELHGAKLRFMQFLCIAKRVIVYIKLYFSMV